MGFVWGSLWLWNDLGSFGKRKEGKKVNLAKEGQQIYELSENVCIGP